MDISRHQGQFDAARAAAKGVQCVMLRAGYGTGRDGRFARFAADCRAAGLRTGAYLFLTCHYRQENARDPAVAEKLLRSQIAALIHTLEGSGVTGWVALDQELEQGFTMGLDPAGNTRLLNLGADLLRRAGYAPCLYCSASWLKSRVLAPALHMPVWLAYYYKSPNDPDFADCSPIRAVNTQWGRYLLSLGDQLIGWQFGRIGHGAEYGAASENIDRDWFYCQPEDYLKKESHMEFKPETGTLTVTSGENPSCEAFRAPDVTAAAEKLEKGSTWPILERGDTQWAGGMLGVWYKIKTESPACYVLALPDRSRVSREKPEVPAETAVRVEGTGPVADLLRSLAVLLAGREAS